MLSIEGDPAPSTGCGDQLSTGHELVEASAGTNGPGTALATASAVEVFASEHFVQAWQALQLRRGPVFRPGPTAQSASSTSPALGGASAPGAPDDQALARAIEERLRAVFAIRDEVVRYAFRAAREAPTPSWRGRQGRVLASNEAATRRRLLSGGALRALRQSLSQALGAPASGSEPSSVGQRAGPRRRCRRFGMKARHGAILRVTSSPRLNPAHATSTTLGTTSAIQGHAAPLRRAVESPGRPPRMTCRGHHWRVGHRQGASPSMHHAGPGAMALRRGELRLHSRGPARAELFGYSRTSPRARDGRAGRFEDADGARLCSTR